MRTVVLAIAVVALSSCALNLNMVDVEQEATPGTPSSDVSTAVGKGTANGSNIIVLSFERSPISTNKDQKSTGEIPIGYNGGTAGSGSGGLTDVASSYAPDLSKQDSENTTTNTSMQTQTTPAKPTTDNEDNESMPEAANGTTGESDDLAYTKTTSYESYGKRNGDRYAWRINKKGPDFGQPIKIVFNPSGKTFTVKDTSKNCRDREDTCDRDRSADMYGFVFKPGIGPNGDGDANTGTSHGGVYLQGPYGLSDQKVTIYYNEK